MMSLGGPRTRLLLMALAPLVPVLAVTLIDARQSREDSLNQVRASTQSLARLAGAWVEQRVQATHNLLDVVARRPATRAGGGACRDELRQVPGYANLMVADPGGRVTCAARPPPSPGSSVAGTGWFRAARERGRPAAGSDFARLIATRPSLVVAVPMRRPPGGVVAAALDLRLFDRLATSIRLPRDSSLVLLGPGGQVLARSPDPERFLGRRLPASALATAARRGVPYAELNGLDGRRRIYGFDRVQAGVGNSLVVATGLSRARAVAPADRMLERTLLVLALVAGGAVVVVLIAAELLIMRPVRAMAAASRRVAAGDLGARTGLAHESGQLGALAASFDAMVDTLEARQREIDRSALERQRLLAQLVAAEEDERKRIAGDIHDDSIQALAALLLRLELLEGRLEDEGHRRALGDAREATREAVARLRHLVFKLSPPALETNGLASTLRNYLDEITRVWGPETALADSLRGEPAQDVRALAYRIAVEAVGNAAKHARAGRIEVAVASQDGGVRVRVADDGTGFDVASEVAPSHYGLRSMRERSAAAGGWWRVESSPETGTTVEFFVPDSGAAGGR